MTDGFVADEPRFEWLAGRAGGWQFGEQGILVALANEIKTPGQCVEIGAGDGDTLPLTIEPFYKYGLECVLYEKNTESAEKLRQKYPKAKHCGTFPLTVSPEIALRPLICVIDVDGIDCVIMENVLKVHRPNVLMVEHFDAFNTANTEDVGSVPDWLLGLVLHDGFTIQDNAATIEAIANVNDYTRLGTTRVNSIFIHDSLVEKVAKHVPS